MTGARVGRNLSFVMGSTVLAMALQYALFFVLARHLQPHAYGAFSLTLTVAVLCGPLWDLGSSTALVFVCSREPGCMPRYLVACVRARIVLLLPVATVAGVVLAAVTGDTAHTLALLLPLLLASFADGFGTLAAAAYQSVERMGVSAAITLQRAGLRALALGLVVAAAGDAGAVAWAFAVASVAGSAVAWRSLRRLVAIDDWRRAAVGPMLRQALPFAAAVVATMLHAQVDVALVAAFCSAEEVGCYHAGMRFFLLAALLPATLATALAPLSYRAGAAGASPALRVWRSKAAVLTPLGVLCALTLALHGADLVRIGFGDGHAAAGAVVHAVAPAVACKFLSSPLGDVLTGLGRQRLLTTGYWLALAVNVGANLWWTPRAGVVGAAWATVASEGVLLMFVAVLATRVAGGLLAVTVLWQPLLVAVVGAGAAALFAGPLPLLLAVATASALFLLHPTAEQRAPRRGLPPPARQVLGSLSPTPHAP